MTLPPFPPDDTGRGLTHAECGLTHTLWTTRLAWSKRLDFIPTAEQAECGLTDAHWAVRRVWIGRLDFTPTVAQVEKGLTHALAGLREKWGERPDLFLSIDALDRVVDYLSKNNLPSLVPDLERKLRAAAEADHLTLVLRDQAVTRSELSPFFVL